VLAGVRLSGGKKHKRRFACLASALESFVMLGWLWWSLMFIFENQQP
jgi:ABC-type transport system involved in cytochrome c biogenesis permease subunit